MSIPSHELPVSACSKCGAPNDLAIEATGQTAAPKSGDYSICIGCGAIMCFDESLHLANLIPLEIESIDDENKALLFRMRDIILSVSLRNTQRRNT